jgi:enhancer of polycomb-like protein
VSIQRGSTGAGLALAGAIESAIETDEQQDKGLGVDASEISEHHLQAALSSSQLASDVAQSAENGAAAAGPSSKPAYHIPTPEAKAVLMQREYYELYPLGAYSDPVTYVRSSKTVEESIRGPSYILDEDDNDWLEDRNKKASEALATAMRSARLPTGALKGKGQEKVREELAKSLGRDNVDVRIISMDEFEMVFTVFEQVTAEKVPFAHIDLSKLPSIEDLLPEFEANSSISQQAFPELPPMNWETNPSSSPANLEWSPENPYRNLSALADIAKVIYPWWKTRKEDREGKSVTPALNFDESKDDDPYVCFRRREVKMIRKTRKTDAAHLEKFVRLRHELQQGVTLLSLLAQREKTKRASFEQDKVCFQTSRELLDVKRQWNIIGPNNGKEDEELVSGDKRDDQQLHGVAGAATSSRKKRKNEEALAAATAQNAAAAAKEDRMSKSARKARTSAGEEVAANGQAANASQSTASNGLGSAILDRVSAVQAYIEREVQRKAESDVGWEEGSDAAFQPIPAPAHIRAFRPIDLESSNAPDQTTVYPWSSGSPSQRGNAQPLRRSGRPASFRKRTGRGGRTWLDRKLPMPSPVPATLYDWMQNNANGQSSRLSGEGTSRQGKASQNGVIPEKGSGASNASASSGPFAFSSSVRPSLLTPAPVITRKSHSHGKDDEAVELTNGGPAQDTTGSDASSSTSSHHSKASATTKATSIAGDETERKADAEEDDDVSSSDADEDRMSEAEDSEEEVERWTRLQERWRYDDESGRWAGLGLCGLGGMEDDDEAILDDFDQRFMRYRMNLLEESDLLKLSTDLSNVMQAQAAADAPSSIPTGYAIFRGETPSMYMQQQQVPLAQQQAAAAQVAALSQANGLARAAQSNSVGGQLPTSQQQQPLQQAQIQLALQQQRAAQVQAQALAAAAAAANTQYNNKTGAINMQQQAQNSPVPRPRSGSKQTQQQQQQQMSAAQQQQHVLAQALTAQNLAAAMAAGQFGNARFGGANGGLQFPANGNGQAHLTSRTLSSSPVPTNQQVSQQQRASPLLAQNGSFSSSPAQSHTVPMGQQQQQQLANGQARLNAANANLNLLNANGQAINPLAAAAALQQAQAALQVQQSMQQQQPQQQSQPAPQFTPQQLMAMQAALAAQNAGLQLKLPQNRARALQIAQQAAMNAGGVQGANAQSPPTHAQLNQAQYGMGLLQNLQQQINFAQQQNQQQQQQQQHGFNAASFNAATAASMAPNATAILAALSAANQGNQGRS